MNSVYQHKVELLLRLMPLVMEEKVFAVHGGTAINLFVKNMPRYSVDIDLTYIPLAGREESLQDINAHLKSIVDNAARRFRGMHIVPNYSTGKLLCEYRGYQVKVEVNLTKRGIVGGNAHVLPLCDRAQETFGMYCEATVVPYTQLYGGKISAALSRQHPRDMFDVKYMSLPLNDVREGLIFCLLGSDRPIHESVAPKLIDQREAMTNQFEGMTDILFSYQDYEETREQLIKNVKSIMTETDWKFLVSFELGEPQWENYEFEYFKNYPSVQWKQLNLGKLKRINKSKLKEEADKLVSLIDRII